jgi:hypothetical protein
MRGVGTQEPFIRDDEALLTRTVQWRKPLSLEEVAQMAQTPEVRARPGRP